MHLPENSAYRFSQINTRANLISPKDIHTTHVPLEEETEALEALTSKYFGQEPNPHLVIPHESLQPVIPPGSLENNEEYLIKLYEQNPRSFPGHILTTYEGEETYWHVHKNHRITNLRRDNQQATLLDHHYSEEASSYADIYYKRDEQVLQIARNEGKESDFLPYRNPTLAADEIVKDWERPFLLKHVSAGNNIYCFGSGTGDTIRFFPFIPPELFTGYDIAKKMVKEARRNHSRYKFIHADTQKLTLAKGSCGVLISNFGPPSYWEDLEEEGRKIFHALTDDGIAMLGFYSHQVKEGLPYEDSTTKEEIKMGIEINFYEAQKAVQILKNAGFPYVVARGVNFGSTKEAYELYQSTGKLYSPEEWKKKILERDAEFRERGIEEHWGRHLYVFASKVPFELQEDGKIVIACR